MAEFLDLNIQIPEDHFYKLNTLKHKLKDEITPRVVEYTPSSNKTHSQDEYYDLVDEILQILYSTADLSEEAFKYRDYIENAYFLEYKDKPTLAKSLWQKHYKQIHDPYNAIKNTCFSYLDMLEDYFIQTYHKKPVVHNKIVV